MPNGLLNAQTGQDAAKLGGAVAGLRSAFDLLDQTISRTGDNASSAIGGMRDAFSQLDETTKETLELFDRLKEFSSSSGFNLDSLMRAIEQLKALRLAGSDTLPFLEATAKIVANAGRGSAELERIARALGEIAAKGRLFTEEINQLGNAGVPVWEMLSDATGKTRDELAKLVRQGKVTSETFIQAFSDFAERIPSSVITARAAVASVTATTAELEKRLASLHQKVFELGSATSAGRSNVEDFDHWLETLGASAALSDVQLTKLRSTIEAVRQAALEADQAEAFRKRVTNGETLSASLDDINRSLSEQANELMIYRGAVKTPIDDVIASFDKLKGLSVPPGSFSSLLGTLRDLNIASSSDIVARSTQLGEAITKLMAPFKSQLNPDAAGTAVMNMVEALRHAWEVIEHQLTPAEIELNRIEIERKDLQDAIPTAATTAAERYKNAWLRATTDVALADDRAQLSMIASQAKIADQRVYHEAQANARVMDFIAQQKGVTDIVADAKIGVMQKTFDGIDSALDRIIPKLHGFGSILKDIIADLLKLELSKFFKQLFGLDTGAGQGSGSNNSGGFGGLFGGGGNGGSGGGGIFGTIKGLFSGGGGPSSGGGVLGKLGGFLGLGSGATAAGSLGGISAIGGGLLSGASAFAAPSALGALAGTGAASTALAGGASAFAGPSAIAALGGGGAAAGAGAAGGASAFSGLLPLLTNPITLIAAGAAIGGFLLWKHFSHGTEKALRKEIQGDYGIDVKDMKTLTEVKQLGEAQFGKGQVKNHVADTVHLGPVRDLLAQYASQTGQMSDKLVTDAQFQDPTFKGNQFIRRLAGGFIPGQSRGFDHVPVLADGGEFMLSRPAVAANGAASVAALNAGQAVIVPRAQTASSGAGASPALHTAFAGALQLVADAVDALQRKIEAMSPGDVMGRAIDQDPHLGGKALEKSADVSSTQLQSALRKMGFARS